MIRILSASLLALAMAAPAAGDETASSGGVVIDQVALDGAFTDLHVVYPDHGAGDVSAAAAAGGNSAAAYAPYGRLDVRAAQHAYGAAIATSTVRGGVSAGAVDASADAAGNAIDAENAGGAVQHLAYQTEDGYTQAAVNVDIETAQTLSTRAGATANSARHASAGGDNRGYTEQTANGDVFADTWAQACCVSETARFETTATGNAVDARGDVSTLVAGAVQLTGENAVIRGRTTAFLGRGVDVQASTRATGNAAKAENAFGFTSLGREGSEVFQGNIAVVEAETDLTVLELYGEAVASAEGVGNALSVANRGADTALYGIQSNYGDVAATATFQGGAGGGVGHVDAVAVGNDAMAMLCDVCGDAALTGSIQQVNYGQVSATAQAAGAGHASVSASAFGNRATFIVGD